MLALLLFLLQKRPLSGWSMLVDNGPNNGNGFIYLIMSMASYLLSILAVIISWCAKMAKLWFAFTYSVKTLAYYTPPFISDTEWWKRVTGRQAGLKYISDPVHFFSVLLCSSHVKCLQLGADEMHPESVLYGFGTFCNAIRGEGTVGSKRSPKKFWRGVSD